MCNNKDGSIFIHRLWGHIITKIDSWSDMRVVIYYHQRRSWTNVIANYKWGYLIFFIFSILPNMFLAAHIYERVWFYFFFIDLRFTVNSFSEVNCLLDFLWFSVILATRNCWELGGKHCVWCCFHELHASFGL